MAHIFVSYSHLDTDFAGILIGKLKDAGFVAWTDTQIRAGEDWREKIDDAINASFCLLVIMSPTAQASEYVTYEWAYAWGAGIRVIPVLLQKPSKLHPRLEALQYLDFTHPALRPWDELIQRLNDLKNTYTPPSKRALNAGIKQLVSDLQNSDSNKRRNAAKALGNIKDESVIPDLAYVLSNDVSWGARRDAAEALGNIGSRDAIVWLVRAIHNDQSYRARESVAWALGEIACKKDRTLSRSGAETIVSSLKAAAYGDGSTYVQQVCIRTLGRISRTVSLATDALIELLNGYSLYKSIIVDELSQNDRPDALAAVEEWRKQQNKQ